MDNVVFRASPEKIRVYGAVARAHGVTRSDFIRGALDQAVQSLVRSGHLRQRLEALHADETAAVSKLVGAESGS